MSSERQSSPNESPVQVKYQDKSAIARFANRKFFQTILSLTRGLAFDSVLDAGCGEGIPLALLAGQRSMDRAVGFDLDLERVRLARRDASAADFLVSNVQSLPFESDSFDLILSLETLEHVGYPERALQEYARVARRYVLLSVPHEPWWRLGNMARLKYLRQWGNTPGHINHWSRGGFQRQVGKYFKVLRVANPFLWTFVLAEKTR